MSHLNIVLDDLTGDAIARFLEEHLEDMKDTSPPESIHALDLEELRQPDITFWSVYDSNQLVGCGALKKLSADHGEIKSMRTSTNHRGKGIASALLQHIIDSAVDTGYSRISLETGSMAFFDPARKLYTRYGFKECSPFDEYQEDPNSIYMTRILSDKLLLE